MYKKKITIIIPNLNGMEHLETCFESISLQTFRDYHVIMVDNGSVDGSVSLIREKYPETEIIELSYNSGFAKAVNLGIERVIREKISPVILLLNNDLELDKRFLETSVITLDENAEASIIAVKMMNYYDRTIFDDTGNFITKKGGTAYPRGNGQKDKGQFDTAEYIFGACAGAAFYRKEVFESAGPFDEEFFAYLEDIDLSFRAQLAGFKC